MPVEPPEPAWVLPDLTRVPAGQELVAIGADLSPGMLLAGYRAGLFAMPTSEGLGWWSPNPRGILRPAEVHVSRSLRRSLVRYRVSVDLRFDAVVRACADPVRPHGWITDEYRASYGRLHELGWAHSIEVWDDAGSLAGGLFGVAVGGLFAAESKFHVRTDASKVAVVGLVALLAGDPDRLVDVQWLTSHLASLGARQVRRPRYLQILAAALALPPVLAAGQGAARAASGEGPLSLIRWRTA